MSSRLAAAVRGLGAGARMATLPIRLLLMPVGFVAGKGRAAVGSLSRTTLCVATAALLATLSLGVMVFRHQVLGDEVKAPVGPGTWKVTLMVQGVMQGDARLSTATPLDFGHQRVVRESCRSSQLSSKLSDAGHRDRHPERRTIHWAQRAGVPDGDFRACYEFYCRIDVHHPTAEMNQLGRILQEPPQPGEHLDAEGLNAADTERLSTVARRETAGRERLADQAEALFAYVDQHISNEPAVREGPGSGPIDCLRAGSGDARAKSRLLVALLRNRGIPARLVTGLKLAKGDGLLAHYWARAWIDDHWMPMCPFNHHYGHVPTTYLVFGHGEVPIVRGRHIRDLDYAFLIEKTPTDDALALAQASPLRRTLRTLSLYMLPTEEQRLVEFLLLLPIAALIVCIYRNVIGIYSFGTFAPALVGLAFRDLHSMPGILVFISILLIGWLLRRALDHYHLLQVPRIAFMLSLVVVVLIVGIVGANLKDFEATKYFQLFPMIILTGMIERFWTLEVEDGTKSSFKTLLTTIWISGTIAVVVGMRSVVDHMFCYPETLGLIMAVQLLIGRYTGYRLSELFRFRDFIQPRSELRLVQQED